MTCSNQVNVLCPSKFGCPPNVCPDFEIKRHDTNPAFKITVSDCDGPLDLTDCVVEVSMWAKAKLKKNLNDTDTYFGLCDCIGFEQSLVGDIIVIDRIRAPEMMLVTGHDEINKLIRVQRAYHGTTASTYKRGTGMRIFRVLNSIGETDMIYEDIEQIDGTTTNELTESQLIYEWQPNDTCLPGCYWLEFKLLKMITLGDWYLAANPIVPTFTSVTPTEAGCEIGSGVSWVRRFPVDGNDGFLIRINNTPTNELLM
jgi:hypothetical protein